MKEAVAAMRAELGSKAVILHSKKYKESGLLGLRTREVVEITAAVEDAPEKNEIVAQDKPTPAAQPASLAAARYKQTPKSPKVENPPTDKKVSDEDVQKLQSVLKRVKENSPIEIESQSDAEILNAPETPKKTSLKAQRTIQRQQRTHKAEQVTESLTAEKSVETPKFEKISSKEKTPVSQPAIDENLTPQSTQTPLPMNFTPEQMAQFQQIMFAQFQQMQVAQQPPQAQITPPASSKSESISTDAESVSEANTGVSAGLKSAEQARIKQLEDELAQMKSMLAEVLGKEPKKTIVTLSEVLKRQDVSEDIISEIPDTSIDYQSGAAKWTLSSYFSEHIKFAEGIKLSRRGAKIVALVGTTGVGKTTTLAKIAAKFVLEQGIGAALITADTYRISAVEQLKTYSDILGLPIEIVYTPQELALAIDRHKDKELILIDTAGRSQYSESQMYELQEFLKVNPRIEKHLVVSASVKLNDAKEIIKKFSAVEPEKIIITKIDETSNFGTVINLLRYENLPLSYLTTGQSVPDDIEVGTPDALASLLLRKIDNPI